MGHDFESSIIFIFIIVKIINNVSGKRPKMTLAANRENIDYKILEIRV